MTKFNPKFNPIAGIQILFLKDILARIQNMTNLPDYIPGFVTNAFLKELLEGRPLPALQVDADTGDLHTTGDTGAYLTMLKQAFILGGLYACLDTENVLCVVPENRCDLYPVAVPLDQILSTCKLFAWVDAQMTNSKNPLGNTQLAQQLSERLMGSQAPKFIVYQMIAP